MLDHKKPRLILVGVLNTFCKDSQAMDLGRVLASNGGEGIISTLGNDFSSLRSRVDFLGLYALQVFAQKCRALPKSLAMG